MQTHSVFRGGVDQLPFGGVRTPDEAAELLKSSIHPDEFERWENDFRRTYGIWHDAHSMVARRFNFYLYSALPNPDLYDRIGSRDRELRLVLAMHRCIVKAEEIRKKLDGMVNEYLTKSSRVVNCRMQGIEPFEARPIGLTPSRCELTGVCICEHRGKMPPYRDGCPGDTTLIRPYEEEYEHVCKSE